MNESAGILAVLAVLFLIVLFILWVLLPFLILGTNRRLDRLAILLNESNEIQERAAADIARLAGEAERSLNARK